MAKAGEKLVVLVDIDKVVNTGEVSSFTGANQRVPEGVGS
jgi:hypothetical protein